MSSTIEASSPQQTSPRRPTSHRKKARWWRRLVGLAVVLALVAAGIGWRTGAIRSVLDRIRGASTQAGSSPLRPSSSPPGATLPTPAVNPTTPASAPTPDTSGPINTAFPGLTTFRGNASRSWYGEGPLPKHPVVLWRYPSAGGLCSTSTDNHGTRQWCGTGWTGQPNVIVQKDGTIEVREGAYDGHYHFLDGRTGRPLRPDLVTGDLAKGSATSDPDGFPLYYGGSRDNLLRVIALDRPAPTVLWSFDANSQAGRVWNNDWDGAPLVIGDYLLEGGENSWFYVVRLHRHYGKDGLVQVDPKIVVAVPGFDDELLKDVGDTDVSIENSVAFRDGVAYFSNSGGLVQGWDISGVLSGKKGAKARRVFRFWDGDDTDASIVIDQEGFLYVARKMEDNVARPKVLGRDHQLGSLIKLDPSKPNDPVVWSTQIGGFERDGGILGTPALYSGVVYVTKTEGGVLAVDQKTGKILWEVSLPGPTWMSPVPIDKQLLVGDCSGVLHDFGIAHPRKGPPRELWRVQLSGCEESTPAVWHGMIYVGTRGGQIYGIGDPKG
jgi:outer membrane protein assembly factor BamB